MSANKLKGKDDAGRGHNLETDPEDIVVEPGVLHSRSHPEKPSFQEVASLSYKPAKVPEGWNPYCLRSAPLPRKTSPSPSGPTLSWWKWRRRRVSPRIIEYTCVDDCGKVDKPDDRRGPSPRRDRPGFRAGYARGD